MALTQVIGRGLGTQTTLAGSNTLVLDTNGIMTKPLQPAFQVTKSAAQNNIATGSNVTVVYGSERFDVNADFASNTFTAPVTGKYMLGARVRVDNLDQAATYYYLAMVTSNILYYNIISFSSPSSDQVHFHWDMNQLADMDAGDTAYMRLVQPDGTAQSDLTDDTGSQSFWGFLVA